LPWGFSEAPDGTCGKMSVPDVADPPDCIETSSEPAGRPSTSTLPALGASEPARRATAAGGNRNDVSVGVI